MLGPSAAVSLSGSIKVLVEKIWVGDLKKSLVEKRSVVISGHKTSMTLEETFWSELRQIAHAQGATV